MKKESEKYSGFVEHNGTIFPSIKSKFFAPLTPGVYSAAVNPMNGEPYLTPISTNTDSLLDLPSPEYKRIVSEIRNFLNPETKQAFSDYGFLYKRSALLHGTPGGGKTGIVNRISQMVVDQGGIVLFDVNPNVLESLYKVLEDVQPDVLTMVIFEEIDSWLEDYEEELLSLLDGEIQKPNIVYLATTNHIDSVPARIRRPGRFSSVIEVTRPNLECRQFYLNTKLKSSEETAEWAKLTEGFTIDELKETVLAVKCLGYTIQQVIDKVNKNRTEIDETAERKQNGKHQRPGLLRF